jgi:transposase
MPKRVKYDVKEIIAVLNDTKSWRAVDKHFNKGNGVVKTWLRKNGIVIEETHIFRLKK